MKYFAQGWSSQFDGPGRRWVIYLHGCNLHCNWCASPDSFLAPGPSGEAPRLFAITAPALLAEARLRQPLFTAGGGVTFGGGEPTLQAREVAEAIRLLRAAGIHTAVESNAATDDFRLVAAETDLIICDIKSLDPDTLASTTGADAGLVAANIRFAVHQARAIWIRVPLVCGVNDSPQAQERIVSFLEEARGVREDLHVDILRMHHLGEPKYAALDRCYAMKGSALPDRSSAEAFAKRLRGRKIQASAFA